MSTSTEDLMTYWLSMGARLEHEVRNLVKITVDSSLGQLGVFGAIAVEDSIGKTKEVFREVVSSYSALENQKSVVDELPVASASGEPQSLSVSEPVGVTSSIPTLFGDGVVASAQEKPSDAPSSAGKKPCENLIRSCDGYMTENFTTFPEGCIGDFVFFLVVHFKVSYMMFVLVRKRKTMLS